MVLVKAKLQPKREARPYFYAEGETTTEGKFRKIFELQIFSP